MIPLSERITLELRHRNPSEITELILDNSKGDKIEGLSEEYVNLKELSMVNVGLLSLVGFPKLPNLEKLDLSDNKISGGLDCLQFCPKLTQLYLASNRIGKIEILDPLSTLQHLDILELFDCPVSETDNYRENVFQLLPQLIYLDGSDQTVIEESEYEYSDYGEIEYLFNDDQPISQAKSGKTSGKKGKYSHVMYQEEELEDTDSVEDEQCERGLVNTYHSEYEEDGEGEHDEEHYEEIKIDEIIEDDANYGYDDDLNYHIPSTHGSKFRAHESQTIERYSRKRTCSYSSADGYDSAWKVFIPESATSVPSQD